MSTQALPQVGDVFEQDGIRYRVTIVDTGERTPLAQKHWHARGQVAYVGAVRATRGQQVHLFRAMDDGSLRFEQVVR